MSEDETEFGDLADTVIKMVETKYTEPTGLSLRFLVASLFAQVADRAIEAYKDANQFDHMGEDL